MKRNGCFKQKYATFQGEEEEEALSEGGWEVKGKSQGVQNRLGLQEVGEVVLIWNALFAQRLQHLCLSVLSSAVSQLLYKLSLGGCKLIPVLMCTLLGEKKMSEGVKSSCVSQEQTVT